MGVCLNKKYTINNLLFKCQSSNKNEKEIMNLEINVEDHIEFKKEARNEISNLKEKDTLELFPNHNDFNEKNNNIKEKEQVISHKIQNKYKTKFFSFFLNINVNNNNSKNNISVKSNEVCENLIYFTNLTDKKITSGTSTASCSNIK